MVYSDKIPISILYRYRTIYMVVFGISSAGFNPADAEHENKKEKTTGINRAKYSRGITEFPID